MVTSPGGQVVNLFGGPLLSLLPALCMFAHKIMERIVISGGFLFLNNPGLLCVLHPEMLLPHHIGRGYTKWAWN